MTEPNVPEWCRWRAGRSAVLVIAPHGGRRPFAHSGAARETPGPRKVNDLYTAGLAEELADALDGALIVNPTLDRNQLDLNRISQVAARAPWFLALIDALLDDILARHACAEVLFVHGWNVVQPKCDLGVGHALADPSDAAALASALTISPAYAAQRLARLRTQCAAVGIDTTFGERYAARHPNNLLQLFRAGAVCAAASPRLTGWVTARRVEAVQLELGVPVRWPGVWRRAFLQAAAAAFTGSAGARAGVEPLVPSAAAPSPRARARPTQPALSPPASLQLYDPRAGLGLTARLDGGASGVSGRVLLFLGGDRVALFLGEDPRTTGRSRDGPDFTATPAGFELRFDGPALVADDGSLYVDLERAFAASQLCAVALELDFRRGLSADYGPASGWIAIDGVRHRIEAPAFARHGILQRSAHAWSSQIALSAAFGEQAAVRVRSEFPGSGALRELTRDGEIAHALPPISVCFDGDRYTPARIRIGDGAELCCQPLSRMAITRPLAAHRQARVTFGAARFIRAAAEGYGFYEYARVLV